MFAHVHAEHTQKKTIIVESSDYEKGIVDYLKIIFQTDIGGGHHNSIVEHVDFEIEISDFTVPSSIPAIFISEKLDNRFYRAQFIYAPPLRDIEQISSFYDRGPPLC